MDILHIKRLLCYQRHPLCYIVLHDRWDWRATAPDTHHLIQHCVCILQPIHALMFSVQVDVHVTTKHMHLMTTTHQMMALLAMMHCFIRTKPYLKSYGLLLSIASTCTYTLQRHLNYSRCFPITVDTKFFKKYCRTSWYMWLVSLHMMVHCNEFADKQQKQTETKDKIFL